MSSPIEAILARIRDGESLESIAADTRIPPNHIRSVARVHVLLSGEKLPQKARGKQRACSGKDQAVMVRLYRTSPFLSLDQIGQRYGITGATVRAYIRRYEAETGEKVLFDGRCRRRPGPARHLSRRSASRP